MFRPSEPDKPAFPEVSQLGGALPREGGRELPLPMHGVDVGFLQELRDMPDVNMRLIAICKYIVRTSRDRLRVIVGDIASIPDLEAELGTMNAEEIDRKYHLLYRNAQEVYGQIFPQG